MKGHLSLYVKGMAMGAADVVPGVSGGTIAFITGIYERLINSIGSVGPQTLKILFQQGIGAAWRSVDGTFLLTLLLGILTSVVSLAKIIGTLLEQQPELLWSFFFGLILVSTVHIARRIHSWSAAKWISFLLGALFAFGLTELAPAQIPQTPLTVFLAGAVAICAMVLPGISGSFILLLMGMYSHIINAIKGVELSVIAIFAVGCGCGLLGFTRFLSWLLRRYHDLTLAILTGFMLGSLNKVWPWKQTLSYRTDSHGEQVPLEQTNLLPGSYEQLTGNDPQLVGGLLLMMFAILLVLGLERLAAKDPKVATAN